MKAKGIEKSSCYKWAGFIGSHTVDLLIEKGYDVTILDNLEYQVHEGKILEYLNKEAIFIKEDLKDMF